MWNNAFAADDPLNAKLADEYGIVMGTSHEEPMMRAEKEWTAGHHGAWDYTTNQKEIDEFWREGMERDKNYEEVVTLGMRGEGDTPMSASANTQLLEQIVADQREILKQTVNPDLDQDSAGVGALQRGAGLLRKRHARARRCNAVVVR